MQVFLSMHMYLGGTKQGLLEKKMCPSVLTVIGKPSGYQRLDRDEKPEIESLSASLQRVLTLSALVLCFFHFK